MWSWSSPTSVGGHRQAAEVRKTGARGLRTTIEEVLLDVMYEIPRWTMSANAWSTPTSSITARGRADEVSEQEIPYAETA